MGLTEVLMTSFINFFADKIPLVIGAITAAAIIAAGPVIMHSGYQKVFEWFSSKLENHEHSIIVVRNGKSYNLPMEMKERLESQGYIVNSPYENQQGHKDGIIYMEENKNDQESSFDPQFNDSLFDPDEESNSSEYSDLKRLQDEFQHMESHSTEDNDSIDYDDNFDEDEDEEKEERKYA